MMPVPVSEWPEWANYLTVDSKGATFHAVRPAWVPFFNVYEPLGKYQGAGNILAIQPHIWSR